MPDDTPVRLVVTRGGDPGPDVLAVVAAVLTRPVVVAESAAGAAAGATVAPTRWVTAARIEAVSPRRRIHTVADL